jgi:hypothetical protein
VWVGGSTPFRLRFSGPCLQLEGSFSKENLASLIALKAPAKEDKVFSKPLVPEAVCEAIDQNRERCVLLENWNLTPIGTIAPVLIR